MTQRGPYRSFQYGNSNAANKVWTKQQRMCLHCFLALSMFHAISSNRNCSLSGDTLLAHAASQAASKSITPKADGDNDERTDHATAFLPRTWHNKGRKLQAIDNVKWHLRCTAAMHSGMAAPSMKRAARNCVRPEWMRGNAISHKKPTGRINETQCNTACSNIARDAPMSVRTFM